MKENIFSQTLPSLCCYLPDCFVVSILCNFGAAFWIKSQTLIHRRNDAHLYYPLEFYHAQQATTIEKTASNNNFTTNMDIQKCITIDLFSFTQRDEPAVMKLSCPNTFYDELCPVTQAAVAHMSRASEHRIDSNYFCDIPKYMKQPKERINIIVIGGSFPSGVLTAGKIVY